jgi:drug/metabolite transporter (DMT)-like permease
MFAAALALLSSASWGTSDFLGGIYSRRRSVWSVVAVAQPAAVLTAALVVIVRGVPSPPLLAALAPFLGGIAAILALVAYYSALTEGAMGVVSPIIASSAAVPVVVGLARGERPSVVQFVGMALAVSGIVLISRTRDVEHRRVRPRSVILALAASAGFGAMLVALDIGGDVDPYWAVLDARIGSVVTAAAYLAIRRPHLSLTPTDIPGMVGSGILLASANMLFALASSLGHLSVIAVLSTLSPVVTTLLAWALLKERLSVPQVLAAFTVLLGVVCLTAG